MKRPRTTRSHYASYLFLALALLADYTDQPVPALVCAGLAAITWKGHRNR